MEKVFIKVPQGCYAKITPTTNKSVVGLLTENLICCTCLIVTNNDRSYCFLAHVACHATNISDPELGLEAWLKEIIGNTYKNDKINITINYGDNRVNGQNSNGYTKTINDIISRSSIQTLLITKKAKIIVREKKNAKCAGIILRKWLDTIDLKTRQQQQDIEAIDYKHGYAENDFTLREDLRNEGYKVIENYAYYNWINSTHFETDAYEEYLHNGKRQILSGMGRFEIFKYGIKRETDVDLENFGDPPFPVICCFDEQNGIRENASFEEIDKANLDYVFTYIEKISNIINGLNEKKDLSFIRMVEEVQKQNFGPYHKQHQQSFPPL